ncbi:MAG TPA: NAD(P)-dependent oxidoreductase [Armatimonadaceae bacterium]|nr:NAD(P)-dependent oxidoreductase [Armatimonadaceae bacterium]
MRVLVTGSSGRVGAYTVRELARAGHDVVHVDRVRPEKPLPGGFIRADLTDAGEVYDAVAQARPEGVCHIAANPSPGGNPRQQIFANNVLSTYNVFQAAGDAASVRRLIYASSEMATGWLTTEDHPAHFPFDESARADTPNAYALSKYLGEVIAEGMSVRYPHMALVSLRINNVIVPDGQPDYADVKKRRDEYPRGGSGNYWAYVDVRDVATAFRAALEGEGAGHEVFAVAAADTCIDVPLDRALTERYGAEVAARLKPGHPSFGSVVDCSKMERFFGWKAVHSWRDQPIPPAQ